jgi:hypothetical protein
MAKLKVTKDTEQLAPHHTSVIPDLTNVNIPLNWPIQGTAFYRYGNFKEESESHPPDPVLLHPQPT